MNAQEEEEEGEERFNDEVRTNFQNNLNGCQCHTHTHTQT